MAKEPDEYSVPEDHSTEVFLPGHMIFHLMILQVLPKPRALMAQPTLPESLAAINRLAVHPLFRYLGAEAAGRAEDREGDKEHARN